MLVGLKKRNAVLVTVPTPGEVAVAEPDPPAPAVFTATGLGSVPIVAMVGCGAGEMGRAPGVGSDGLGVADFAPGVTGPLGRPALTGEGDADLPIVTVRFVTGVVRLVFVSLRLAAFG